MSNLKYRLLLIAAMIVAAVWSLFPRSVVERVRRGDRYVYDTTTRVPLKRGLDLQGGMHLSLEIDEAKQAVTDKSEALDRALKVVRTRIDEFGVSEPIVQKSGADRIIVELPGIDDEARAIDVVQKSAFLQFQITDETRALEKVLPRLDAIIRESGAAADTPAGGDTTTRPGQKGLQELFTPGAKGDSTAKAAGDSAAGDSATNDTAQLNLTTGGPFSKLIVGGGEMPGEYFVAESDVLTAQHYLDMPAVRAALPPGKTIRWGADPVSRGGTMFRPLYVVDTSTGALVHFHYE